MFALVGALVLGAALAPAAARAQTVADPAGDSPAGPAGGVDVREVSWSVEEAQATVVVRWARTGSAVGQATPKGALWGDVNGDAVADIIVAFTTTATSVQWQLLSLDGGQPGCQPTTGTLQQAATSPLTPLVGTTLESWQVAFPSSALRGAAAVRWALLAYTEPPGGGGASGVHWDAVPDAASGGGTSPDDRRCAAVADGLRVDLAGGADAVGAPQPPVVPPPVVEPPVGQPPIASLALGRPTTFAGRPVHLDASASRAPGGTIVAYEWDWNGDGRYEANTGSRPTAKFVFGGAGKRTIGVQVTDDKGVKSSASLEVDLSGPPGKCLPKLDLSLLRIAAPCIRKEGSRWVITSDPVDRTISINGLALTGSASYTIDLKAATFTASGGVELRLLNTPLGDILLYRTKKLSWSLGSGGASASAATHSGSPGFRLATFGAGEGCTDAERTFCAKLPGGFPLTGQVDLFLTKSFDLVIDAHAKLSTVFEVTGDVLLHANREIGLKLDSLNFHMENAQFGIFTLKLLDFSYTAPGTNGPKDQWTAELEVVLPTPVKAGVAGRLEFLGGKFQYGRAELTLAAGVPIGPGITLKRFLGEFGTNPVRIGGGLGIGLAGGVGQIDGDFNYTRLGDGSARIHVGGAYKFLGHTLATAYFDHYSTGYTAFGGQFFYRSVPLDITGAIDVWYESKTLYEASGQVDFRVWLINGSAEVLVNDKFIAGCAKLTKWGKGAFAVYDRKGDYIRRATWGCDMALYRAQPTQTQAQSAVAAQAGVRTLRVAPGLRALGVAVRGADGPPAVRFTSPDGRVFTTPAVAGEVAQADGFVAAQLPDTNEAIVRFERPRPGLWRIEALDGSPRIVEVRTADPLPSRPVRASLSGSGRARTLAYRFDRPAGGSVRFVARGSDSTQVLATTSTRAGRIRFVPDEGLGRSRRIEAQLIVDGMPQASTTVARFTAPPVRRPGRPGRVLLRRAPRSVVVTWAPAARATGYSVSVRSSDGRRLLFVRGARSRRVVVTRVLSGERLTVTVRGQRGASRRSGPPRVAVLRR